MVTYKRKDFVIDEFVQNPGQFTVEQTDVILSAVSKRTGDESFQNELAAEIVINKDHTGKTNWLGRAIIQDVRKRGSQYAVHGWLETPRFTVLFTIGGDLTFDQLIHEANVYMRLGRNTLASHFTILKASP
jgi:hypothetical protein